VLLVGGARSAFDACADLFTALSERAFPLGVCGNGAKMKLVVNLVLGLHRAVLAEGRALAERLALDPATTLEVLRCGAAASRVMEAKGEKMLRRDFTPQARLAQHLKDVRLILSAGARVDARLPLTEVHRQLLTRLDEAGLGPLDNSAIRQAFD
jgi:3-hydroxyisobutyrate dehydrogenase-like beta-hydroxyacid dehydrogenase